MYFEQNFHKNINYFYCSLVVILIVKLFTINSIHKNRELPIEPDDAYTYIAHSYLAYKDFDRNKKTMRSIADIVYSAYDNEISQNSQNVVEVSRIERYLIPRYFLYSKTFGFIKKNFRVQNIQLWWYFNYFSQILILLSALLFIQRFLAKKKNFYKLICLLSSFFFVLSVKHQIMGTPMTIGTSILLIGICFSLNIYNKYLNFTGPVLIFLSLHFHPGVFLVSSIFIGTYFLMYIIYKKDYLNCFIRITFPVLLALVLEQFLFFLEINRYLGIFETMYVGQEFAKIDGLIEIFNFNWESTKKNFISMMYPLTPFFFHKKIIIFFFYLISIFVAFKTNKELFILNCFILISIIIGCFYFISLNHSGNIIFYQMQGMIPILSITFFNMYFFYFEKIDQKLNIKKPYILMLFVMIIFLNNTSDYFKMIKNRTNKANFENITVELDEFNKKYILNENDAMIIGDELILFMYFSLNENINIYLDNKMRKGDKIWHQKIKNFNPKGYIGKIDENKIIKNTIKYGQNSITFKNIKKFENFYFLYN